MAVELAVLTPVAPPVLVSVLGTDAVVSGCLATGAERAWERACAVLSTLDAAPDPVVRRETVPQP